MKIIKTNIVRFYRALYDKQFINVDLHCDGTGDTNENYVMFSVYTMHPNQFFDICFKYSDMPEYVLYIYKTIEANSHMFISPDKNGYIITGPCLQKKEIFKTAFVYKSDYYTMLNRPNQIMYDKELEETLAEQTLKYIYDDMVGSPKYPLKVFHDKFIP